MVRAKIVISEHFIIKLNEFGETEECIYNPPLLAKTTNLRVELRKESNHFTPHVHIIKKGTNGDGVSIALDDDFTILAGENELAHFDEREFEAIANFLVKNQNHFRQIYKILRGKQ